MSSQGKDEDSKNRKFSGSAFAQKSITQKYMQCVNALYGNTEPPNQRIYIKPKRSEAAEQMALVAWARANNLLLISIPNAGKRSYHTGQKERAMGLTAGVSDLFLAMPRNGYAGYWVEMKSKGNKPKPLQYEWLDKMRQQGYKADWYDNWENAKSAIEKYLKIDDTL